MRLLFLMLVLANAAFFTYDWVAQQQVAAESQSALLQINPEKIRIIRASGGAAPAITKPAAPAAAAPGTAPAACLEWGYFAGPEVARADAAIGRLELPQALVQRVVADVGGYWVYIPPQKTKAEADRKIRELKALGVTDFFAVQEQNQWRHAISLGIFKSEDAAKGFLAALGAKGVRSAIVERRENFLKQMAYFVREPNPAMVARLAELQREFSGSEVKAVACPPAGA
ncbi:MAG: SPOR domain-containing protein [Burkholderiales bacterium]|nr:SPOR domain-containing protein [Burkholderiales bacterium]